MQFWRHGVGLLLFTLAFYASFWLDQSTLGARDPRIVELFSAALRVPAVRLELLRNLAGHLLPLLSVYVVSAWIARTVALLFPLRPAVARVLLLTSAWLLLLNVNSLLFPLSNYSIAFDAALQPALMVVATLVLLAGLGVALWSVRGRQLALMALVSLAGVLLWASLGTASVVSVGRDSARRDIILVGIDSLSDQVASQMLSDLPELAGLLAQAERFKRAYTPLARTFPAWTSPGAGCTWCGFQSAQS